MTSATATPTSNDPKSLHERMLEWMHFLYSDTDQRSNNRLNIHVLLPVKSEPRLNTPLDLEAFKNELETRQQGKTEDIFAVIIRDLLLDLTYPASDLATQSKAFTLHEIAIKKLTELSLTESVKDSILKSDQAQTILSKFFEKLRFKSPGEQIDLSDKTLRLFKMAGLPLELAAYKPDNQKEIISNLLCCAPEIPALFCLTVDNTKPTGHAHLWWQGILDNYIEATKTSDSFTPEDKIIARQSRAKTHAMTTLQKLIDDCGLPQPDLSSPIGAILSNQYQALFGFNIRDYYARKQPARADTLPNNTMMIDATTPVLGTVSITSPYGTLFVREFGNQGR